MLEQFLNFLNSIAGSILPWVIMDPYEKGVVLRLGSFNRVAESGRLVWRWPGFERVLADNVAPRTTYLSPQSLVAADGTAVTLRIVATWRIVDIRQALLEVDGIDDVVKDTYYAAAGDAVSKADFASLNDRKFLTALKNECQKRADSYGVEVIRIGLGELSRCRTVRLIQA